MALNFVNVIDLTEYEENPSPTLVSQLSIIHEANDGEIVQYYIDPTGIPGDKNSHAIGVLDVHESTYDYYDYPELTWGNQKRRITTRRTDRLGIKAFPGVGACAFYKLAYQVLSKIVIPVNNKQKLYPYPTQEVTITGSAIHFVFTDPEKVTYQCYRVVLRCGEYAEEYITYEHELDCPLPQMNGEYEAYTQGYISEGEEVSELSPSYFFTVHVEGQSDRPPTTTAGSDIFVKGLSFTQDNHLRATLTDGRNVDSANTVPEELPGVGAGDNGKLLGVVGGQWSKKDAPVIGIVFWRVLYYSTDGSTLLHKEYVEDGDNASWQYQDDNWSLTAGGPADPNAKISIRANKSLYYVEPEQ